MNILYVGGESANWVIRLCNEMAIQGHTVSCVVQKDDTYLDDLKTVDNLHVISVTPKIMSDSSSFSKHVFPELLDKYDVVCGSHVSTINLSRGLSEHFHCPWISMILDIPSDLMETDKHRMNNWYNYFWVLQTANAVIVNTEIAQQEFYRYTNRRIPDEHVITYGTALRPEFKLTGNLSKPEILSICRLTEAKNCKLIPEALKYLNAPLKYTAIGRDGGQLQEIQKLCKEYGIDFEHIENISEHDKYRRIQDCAMLIYPQKTPYIGGLSPFESIYVGKKTLVPNLPVMEHLYGDSIFAYFENDDALDLASKISLAWNFKDNIETQKWRKMSADYAEQEASFTNMSSKILKIVEEIVNG